MRESPFAAGLPRRTASMLPLLHLLILRLRILALVMTCDSLLWQAWRRRCHDGHISQPWRPPIPVPQAPARVLCRKRGRFELARIKSTAWKSPPPSKTCGQDNPPFIAPAGVSEAPLMAAANTQQLLYTVETSLRSEVNDRGEVLLAKTLVTAPA